MRHTMYIIYYYRWETLRVFLFLKFLIPPLTLVFFEYVLMGSFGLIPQAAIIIQNFEKFFISVLHFIRMNFGYS